MIRRNPKNEFYDEVQFAYFTGKYTHREISNQTGVPERTIRNWIKDGNWARLRENARRAPAVLLDNFISQLMELQNLIASRPPGERWPRGWEVDIEKKLLGNINGMQDFPSELIASYGIGLVPISDVVFEEDAPTDMEKYQLPFQEPLRVMYNAYESEGIEVHYKVNDSLLEEGKEWPESSRETATNGQNLLAENTTEPASKAATAAEKEPENKTVKSGHENTNSIENEILVEETGWPNNGHKAATNGHPRPSGITHSQTIATQTGEEIKIQNIAA